MKLKNFLIVVEDLEKSAEFYCDLFGLGVVLRSDGNFILTDGLVLQQKKIWESYLENPVSQKSNSCELYFEEPEIEAFASKLQKLYPDTEFLKPLEETTFGQKIMIFYDLDGNLIEVRTPN